MSEPERPLPGHLARQPELDTWLRIESDRTVTLRTGKVELGQGLKTAIARIGAEELDVSLARIRVETADSARGPNELMTVGSMSLEESGNAIRRVAAEARQYLLELAAQRLRVPIGRLEVDDGTVSVRGGSADLRTSYWELLGGRDFARRVTGEAVAKRPEQHRIVGKPGPRIDLRAKLTGGAFLHDLAKPGLLFGRVLRPPSPGARLEALDDAEVRALPGVRAVVRDGSFVGVVAEREEQALHAHERLASLARWRETPSLPGHPHALEHLLAQPRQSFPVNDGTPARAPVPPYAPAANAHSTLAARYLRPYQMHASIGPSAALAQQTGDELTVWSHSQAVPILRHALARSLGIAPEQVRVIHADGAGCYGHNGADDVALDAALLARAVPGAPVRVQWSREDEHAWEPYGPAMAIDLRASLDAGGRVLDWSHEVASFTHMGRAIPARGASNLVADWHREPALPPIRSEPRLEPHAGIHLNADPLYVFPNKRVVKHFVEGPALRVSSTRGLGAYANVFAIESFVDELALAAGADPLAFRLAHLQDPRARAVLESAAARAGWRKPAADGRGQGLGFARYKNAKCYAAVVVELEVDAANGAIRLLRAVIAADAGEVVDPDGLVNQLEGGFIQSASWTLWEEVRFDRTRITSRDWDSYPILRFSEVPEIETVLLDRPGSPFLGAGEATQGPTPAAIANAIAHATGARLRRIPFTPQRVREALKRR
ncbi:MAG: molybdopterin cofactor-binding domain-containing protein [Myxococcota bacterium]